MGHRLLCHSAPELVEEQFQCARAGDRRLAFRIILCKMGERVRDVHLSNIACVLQQLDQRRDGTDLDEAAT